MAEFSICGIGVRGLAACVPTRIDYIRNYQWMGAKDRENFIKTVGVSERRFAEEGVTTADLCQKAASNLLDSLKWEKDSVDILVFVAQARDYLIPATSIVLQHKLGLSQHCMAFDIDLGCSGFVIGMQVVASMLASSQLKRALLLVGDVTSANLSYRDKTTYPLFGDAGTATALEYDPHAAKMTFNTMNNGKDFDALYIPAGGMRKKANRHSFDYKSYGKGIIRNDTQVIIDGLRVFNFSITDVPPQISACLLSAGKTIEQIDYFVMHQANRVMNETIRKKLRIPIEKYPYSIDRYGNTSSASIPLTMVTELRDQLNTQKLNLLISGFGVGLSYATAVIELPPFTVLPLIEYT